MDYGGRDDRFGDISDFGNKMEGHSDISEVEVAVNHQFCASERVIY
jgi:hypothetical protein